ncbi:flavin oxidoreductase [Amycolatopsis sp. WAC 04182]|uniref:flavin reductase family protein n=1 Tax=Amycolatopsis sp. WAC 04182 TaxID=2203198 RepID=UPI000F770D55|nr:flavin reductase family protein [Amycolatopsis sp. WAC 04182]RSN54424.1 flavin oxidoreductase [Amycolatopsis sp. WAC 04182]
MTLSLTEDQAGFRSMMAQWPTGVTVVTTTGPDGPAGCTVNALMSLSDSPPLIVLALCAGSATLGHLRRAGKFAITVLSSGQGGLCSDFSALPAAQRFHRTEIREVDGLPVPDGGVAALTCDVADEIPYADHVLVVGAPRWSEIRDELSPLLVHRRELKAVL